MSKMEELQSRFERIKSSISAELSEIDTISFPPILKDDASVRNINYYRRSLYSDIELFKMELEEYISVDETMNSAEHDRNNSSVKVAIDRTALKSTSHSSSNNNSPPRGLSTITSPLMNRLDVLSNNTSYVDSNRSNVNYKATYNDIDINNHENNDRERLLNDLSSSSSSFNQTNKHSINIEEDDSIIESKSSEKSSYRSPVKNVLQASNSSKEHSSSSSSKKNDVRENVSSDVLRIKQMIEECSSISGRFGLKFAKRNPHWYVL
jgi:hypothetical protein